MYEVEKRLTLPIGHRLSKHAGRCVNFHGHNLSILLGIKSKNLNYNDMVIDFSDLKDEAMKILDEWDHCLLINKEDPILDTDFINGYRVIPFDFDPTAERLCELLYTVLKPRLKNRFGQYIELEYVTIYENENSKATYYE